MPVVRNPNFYFREGFCWTDIHTKYLKSRIKENGIYDVKSMSLFSLSNLVPDWYVVCLLNSKYISEYTHDFINNTQTFQINDARIVPIIVPNKSQLKTFENIFSSALKIKKEFFNNKLELDTYNKKILDIQKKLDKVVYQLYNINT